MILKGFFPTYGGGHVKAVTPIIKRLIELSHSIEVLALTNSVIELKKNTINFTTISQYKKIYSDAEVHFIQELGNYAVDVVSEGINIDDAHWYHGVGLFELVNELGYELAISEYDKHGRKAFLPIDFARRTLRLLTPDFIFVTCGQRLEKAFAIAANEMDIKVFRLIDLISNSIKVDYKATFLVGNLLAKNKLAEINDEKNKIIVTGNPNFEYQYCSGKVESTSVKTIVYFSQPGVAGRNVVLNIFNKLCKQSKDVLFLYKPHPNENLEDLIPLSNEIQFTDNIDANELIAKSDVILTHFSSVGFQAINQDKPLITINFNMLKFPLNYKEMGCAKEVVSPLALQILILAYINSDVSFINELNCYSNYKQPSNSYLLITNAIINEFKEK
jgi:hypothetical protein